MGFFERKGERSGRSLLHGTSSIGAAAFIISAAGIVSRLLGFVRDRLLAGNFGAGDRLDAYYAAFRIPDTIYNLLVMGALSAAFVPVFTDLLSRKGREEAVELAVSVMKWIAILLGGFSVLASIFAPSIVPALAPGFSGSKRELTVALSRIMLLSPIFLGVSAIFGGVALSLRKFLFFSLAPIFYNIGIITGILLFVPKFGMPGLAWGVVLGAVLHMTIQSPSVRDIGFFRGFFRRSLRFDGPVRRVVTLMIPRTLGVAANQVSLLLTTVFSSFLLPGSLAIFTFASNIQAIPIGLFAVSFSLAAFPNLSFSASERRDGEFFGTLSRTTKRILFFVLPASMLFIVFRAQVVRIVLGSGRFDWEDTIATFGVLAWLSASLFAQGLVPLFARAFYALQDTRTPLYFALVGEAVFALASWTLLPILGVDALAVAFSLGTVVNFFLLLLALRKKVREWDDRRFFREPGLIVLSTVIAGAVAQFSKSVFAFFSTSPLDTFFKVFLQLSFGSALAIGTFLLLCHHFRIGEYRSIRRFVLAKVFRSPEAVSSVEGHPEKGDW